MFKPSLKHFRGFTAFPNQNFKQIDQRIPEFWYRTDKQRKILTFYSSILKRNSIIHFYYNFVFIFIKKNLKLKKWSVYLHCYIKVYNHQVAKIISLLYFFNPNSFFVPIFSHVMISDSVYFSIMFKIFVKMNLMFSWIR